MPFSVDMKGPNRQTTVETDVEEPKVTRKAKDDLVSPSWAERVILGLILLVLVGGAFFLGAYLDPVNFHATEPHVLAACSDKNGETSGAAQDDESAEVAPTAAPSQDTIVVDNDGPQDEIFDPLSLQSGELSGYTGWNRPRFSLRSLFSPPTTVNESVVGSTWTVRVENTATSSALLYARAYGPAILHGLIINHQNGTYDVDFTFFDAGNYHVEVAVTMSQTPDLYDVPLANGNLNVPYEGYLLPGFPLQVSVKGNATVTSSTRRCTVNDLAETSLDERPKAGRWKVTERLDTTTTTRNLLTGYEASAFKADFVRPDCQLLSNEEATPRSTLDAALAGTKYADKPIHIIFVGDSNTGRTRTRFRNFFGGTSDDYFITRIHTEGGLAQVLPNVTQSLNNLRNRDHYFFLFFNSGIHDTEKICANQNYRQQYFGDVNLADFSCLNEYLVLMTQFIDLMMSFPAELRVFKTTFSTWQRWGISGVTWNVGDTISGSQRFPLMPELTYEANRIALNLLRDKDAIIMDAWHLTHARPDQREIASDLPTVWEKLLHSGEEVYNLLARQFASMILDTIEGAR